MDPEQSAFWTLDETKKTEKTVGDSRVKEIGKRGGDFCDRSSGSAIDQ